MEQPTTGWTVLWSGLISYFCTKKLVSLLSQEFAFDSILKTGCTTFVLRNSHLGRLFKTWLLETFILQKWTVRVISCLKSRESCRETFRELGVLTLPCIFILEIAAFCKFKTITSSGRDVHGFTLGLLTYWDWSNTASSVLSVCPHRLVLEFCISSLKVSTLTLQSRSLKLAYDVSWWCLWQCYSVEEFFG